MIPASANAKGVNNMGDGPIESVETMMGNPSKIGADRRMNPVRKCGNHRFLLGCLPFGNFTVSYGKFGKCVDDIPIEYMLIFHSHLR